MTSCIFQVSHLMILSAAKLTINHLMTSCIFQVSHLMIFSCQANYQSSDDFVHLAGSHLMILSAAGLTINHLMTSCIF